MERIGGVWTAHGKNARIGGEKKKEAAVWLCFGRGRIQNRIFVHRLCPEGPRGMI